MKNKSDIVKGFECCILRNPDDKQRCDDCPYKKPLESNCVNRLKMDALELLKEQDSDAEIIRDCRSGAVVKHLGKGVVVLNYNWWRNKVIEMGEFRPVPTYDELFGGDKNV